MKERMGKFQSGLLIAFVLIAAITAGAIAFVLFDTSGTRATVGPEYRYDVRQYAEIDPALILYRQAGTVIQTDFETVNAIAADTEDRMYVAGDERIVIYTADGNLFRQIELDAEPTCVTVDRDGMIAVGLQDRIVMLDLQGSRTGAWDIPAETEQVWLTALATNKNNVFAADAIGKVIWRFDRTGRLINKIGEKNTDRNISGFVIPSPYFDIAMAPDGLLRAVNPGRHLIEAYTPGGDREWAWGKPAVSVEGFSGCCNPINFAILPDGGFITCEKGLVRIKEYDADGQFIGVVAGPEQVGWTEPLRVCRTPEECSSKGFDVAVDTNGRVYILDMVEKNIRVFERK